MKQSELLHRLKEEVNQKEWGLLEADTSSLVISSFNRNTLLLMKEKEIMDEKEISEEKAEGLYKVLKSFLEQYMAKQPEGHKWIILSCIFLVFIQEQPMHPQDITHIKTENDHGNITYFCPCKEEGEGNVCSYCVCRPLKNVGQKA